MFTMNNEFEHDTDFINSQPSLAECLASFAPVDVDLSVKALTLTIPRPLIPPPFEQHHPTQA